MQLPELKLRRAGSNEWMLTDALTGADVGGISYQHDVNGDHYRAWTLNDAARQPAGGPLPQLTMAARAVADAITRARMPQP
jgi:hypothetical protein